MLNSVDIKDNSINFQYMLDGEPIRLNITYNSVDFNQLGAEAGNDTLRIFSTNLGAVQFFRFAAVLPERFYLGEYSSLVSPAILDYLKAIFPHWSEHRFQAGRMDFQGTEIILSDEHTRFPDDNKVLSRKSGRSNGVMVASGSGKDSLLCAKLLETADVEYDIVTYIHDLYGEIDGQNKIFDRLASQLNFRKHHIITIDDDYFPWLDKRMSLFGVTEYLAKHVVDKPFRKEAAEVLISPLLFAPIQVSHDIELAIVGHEKSADAVNLIEPHSGENIYHQWEKSFEAEKAVGNLLKSLFNNIECVSITKPIYDVAIFKHLFQIAGDLPYLTNSCNIKKPWCCECEKCAYVFAGFSAFGDHSRTVACYGDDMFDNEALLPIWRKLLGLEGYIPWECVGLADETKLYFYKAYCAGVKGAAIELFCAEVLSEYDDNTEKYFDKIEQAYLHVDIEKHHIPDWLWEKVAPILQRARS